MGGTPTTVQNTSQQSSPWAPAQPALQGILSSLQPLTSQPGITPTEQAGLSALTANAQAGNPYASGVGSLASNLLSGGNAGAQSGLLSGALSSYQQGLSPYLSSSYLNPMNTPGFGAALSGLNNSITNQVNGQFAAAGRDLSPANSQALATGLSQGEGQLVANQYNQNVANQLGALNSGYGAANTTAGLLTNLNQTGLSNQQQGIGAAEQALGANNYTGQQLLSLGQTAQELPVQYLQGLTGIAQPIAGLGGQSTGTSTTQTQTPLINQIAGGAIGGLGLLGATGGLGPTGWAFNPGGSGLLNFNSGSFGWG